jgi:hypothetical protein
MSEGLVTILVFAANPLEDQPLRLDEEMREIREKIRAADGRDRVRLETRWATRPDDLLQGLNELVPQVVHFSGHGTGKEGIVLQRSDGGPVTVAAKALKSLFQAMKDNVRLVFLNACFSEQQAQGILDAGIDAVVGMGAAIGDDTARVFAAAFYRAVAFYRSVEQAFEQGLAAIAVENLGEENTPRLLTRSGVQAAELYIVRKPTLDLPPGDPAPPVRPRGDPTPAPSSPVAARTSPLEAFMSKLASSGVAGTWVENNGQGQMMIVGAPPHYQYREFNMWGVAVGEGTIEQRPDGLVLLGSNSFVGPMQGRVVVSGDRLDLTIFTVAGAASSVWTRRS